MMYPPFSQSLERSSVHVTYNSNQVGSFSPFDYSKHDSSLYCFLSPQIENIVTEAYFVSIFSKYGTVIDAAVKRFEINEVSW